MLSVDRNLRTLIHLQDTASTSRVLNLHAVWRRWQNDADYRASPMFRNTLLNRAFLIRHRLRRNETDLFREQRQTATKVLLPLESTDLKMGGRYVFVGQKGYEDVLVGLVGSRENVHSDDFKLLDVVDRLPSLDPFLLREQIKRHGFNPARFYFELSEADTKRMFEFVQAELNSLVQSAFNGESLNANTARLVTKILSSSNDEDTEPLRLTLRLQKQEYQEGVFCWKGFLYYKWSLSHLVEQLRLVARQIASIKPEGPMNDEARQYIQRGRATITAAISSALGVVAATLQVYDDAYANLTKNGRPLAFREFLLDAPHLFTELGERIGVLNHINSFWRFRFPEGQPRRVSVEELLDILMDFETGLNFQPVSSARSLEWA